LGDVGAAVAVIVFPPLTRVSLVMIEILYAPMLSNRFWDEFGFAWMQAA
jgi:hypothetical protein